MKRFGVKRFGRCMVGLMLLACLFPIACRQPEQRVRAPGDQSDREKPAKQRMERRMRDDGAPKVGDLAPNFKLKSLDGEAEVELVSFRARRPVVVFFGSYT